MNLLIGETSKRTSNKSCQKYVCATDNTTKLSNLAKQLDNEGILPLRYRVDSFLATFKDKKGVFSVGDTTHSYQERDLMIFLKEAIASVDSSEPWNIDVVSGEWKQCIDKLLSSTMLTEPSLPDLCNALTLSLYVSAARELSYSLVDKLVDPDGVLKIPGGSNVVTVASLINAYYDDPETIALYRLKDTPEDEYILRYFDCAEPSAENLQPIKGIQLRRRLLSKDAKPVLITATGAMGKSTYLRRLLYDFQMMNGQGRHVILPIYISASEGGLCDAYDLELVLRQRWEEILKVTCLDGLVPVDMPAGIRRVVLIIDELDRSPDGFVYSVFQCADDKILFMDQLSVALKHKKIALSIIVASRETAPFFAHYEHYIMNELSDVYLDERLSPRHIRLDDTLRKVLRFPIYLRMYETQLGIGRIPSSYKHEFRASMNSRSDLFWNYQLFELIQNNIDKYNDTRYVIEQYVVPCIAFHQYQMSAKGFDFEREHILEALPRITKLLKETGLLMEDMSLSKLVVEQTLMRYVSAKGEVLSWNHPVYFEYLVARHIYNVLKMAKKHPLGDELCLHISDVNSLHNDRVESFLLELIPIDDIKNAANTTNFHINTNNEILSGIQQGFQTYAGNECVDLKSRSHYYALLQDLLQFYERDCKRNKQDSTAVLDAFIMYLENLYQECSASNSPFPHEALVTISRRYWRGHIYGTGTIRDYAKGVRYAQVAVDCYELERHMGIATECRAYNALAKSVNALLEDIVAHYIVSPSACIRLPSDTNTAFCPANIPENLTDAYKHLYQAVVIAERNENTLPAESVPDYCLQLHRFVECVLVFSSSHDSSESQSLLAMLYLLQYEAKKCDETVLLRAYELFEHGGRSGKVSDYCKRRAAQLLGEYWLSLKEVRSVRFSGDNSAVLMQKKLNAAGSLYGALYHYLHALLLRMQLTNVPHDVHAEKSLVDMIENLVKAKEDIPAAAIALLSIDVYPNDKKALLVHRMLSDNRVDKISIRFPKTDGYMREKWHPSKAIVDRWLEQIRCTIKLLDDDKQLLVLYQQAQQRLQSYPDFFFYLPQSSSIEYETADMAVRE